MQNKKVVFVSIIVLIAIFLGAGYFYKNEQTKKSIALAKEEALLFQRPYSLVIGNKDAKVQLVEFIDPACGTCAQFHPYVKDILKKNDGNVKLVVRYAPFHKNSAYAVKMLEGSREQNKFMDVLDFMFATRAYWIKRHEVQPQILWNLLHKVEGLDMDKLAKFMDNSKTDEIIKQDLADAKKLGVTKTPGYIVNGKPLQEFGLKNLIKLIESEL
ncbi:MAG: thioredoxin domain-containing protein [Arcobacter sp.]|nr:thioredoxin domain-containing protein [Arcobacter sp.]